jgi:hypothetical protein
VDGGRRAFCGSPLRRTTGSAILNGPHAFLTRPIFKYSLRRAAQEFRATAGIGMVNSRMLRISGHHASTWNAGWPRKRTRHNVRMLYFSRGAGYLKSHLGLRYFAQMKISAHGNKTLHLTMHGGTWTG